MSIQLIAVGNKMPKWVQEGYSEYHKRLPKDVCPKLIELTPGHRGKSTSVATVKAAEAQAILKAIPDGNTVVALEVKGKPWSTEQLSEQLDDWRMSGRNISFIIGGPDGLSQECLQRADAKWSMSNLTLPHPLVRVVFIEQLYRAWSILQGHPYHK